MTHPEAERRSWGMPWSKADLDLSDDDLAELGRLEARSGVELLRRHGMEPDAELLALAEGDAELVAAFVARNRRRPTPSVG